MIAPDREGAAYRQLAGILRDRISNGELPPGQRVPSEKDLHDEFGLARETIRRAVAVLRDEGIVEIRCGRGTFVVDAPPSAELEPGDCVTSTAAMTVTRAGGVKQIYPAGTRLTVGDGPRHEPASLAAMPIERAPVSAAVIVADGRVLMVRRRVAEGELSWQFPAGEMEPGESAEDAAVRETREETGMTVRAEERLGGRVHPATGRAMFYIACTVVDGTAHVADQEEVAEVAWCDRATLTAYVPYPLFGPAQDYLEAVLT